MLLGTLGPSLLGNMLAGKGITRAGYGSKDLKKENEYLEQIMDLNWISNTASSLN